MPAKGTKVCTFFLAFSIVWFCFADNVLTGVKTFGAPVVKLELEQSTQSGSQSVSQIATNQPIQNPILSSFSRDANKASVNADITAAFLGAGIPLEKLDHPSMKGFLKKYSTVHGTIRDAHTLRQH